MAQLQMLAMAITATDGLEPVTLPVPEPGPGQVLIRVHAAGVNRADLLQRRGKYPPPPGASPIPGLEVAGTVAATGPGVTMWQAGDEVCALLSGGGYAGYALAEASLTLPVPGDLSLAEAAAVPEGVFTVWANLFHHKTLQPKETLLVHGGASGIGTFAIQMARAMGCKVIATVRRTEKMAVCESLGAKAINETETDFVAAVQDMTGGRGVDVVLDMLGGDMIARNLACLATSGRHVSIAAQKGAKVDLDLGLVMQKRLTLTGSTLRSRPLAEKATLAWEVEQTVWPWLESAKVKPVLDQSFPLADAMQAHERMTSGLHIGKITLLN